MLPNTSFLQIVSEQKEEIALIKRYGWLPRDKEKFVNPDSRLAQVITGVRRCGKSTLAHRSLQGYHYAYINFDDERLMGISADNLNLLLESLYAVYGNFTHLILDEIQNLEYWHLFVNRLLRNNIRIIITGSNSKLLSRELATHLTGRYVKIELFPFSFSEFLRYKKLEVPDIQTAKGKGLLLNHYEQYMSEGGFPEILAGEPLMVYARNLFEAIVTRDIIYRYSIRFTRTFREIATWFISNYSTEISHNRLKNIFSLGSENTAKNYVSYLEEAYLIMCLPKFSFKKQETLRYRKYYLIDTAFIQMLGENHSKNSGRILENIVFLSLARKSTIENFEIFFYKKNNEVDFVVYKDQKVEELIQVSQRVDNPKTLNREIRALIIAAKELNSNNLKIITLNFKDAVKVESYTIQFIPITEWLLRQETSL